MNCFFNICFHDADEIGRCLTAEYTEKYDHILIDHAFNCVERSSDIEELYAEWHNYGTTMYQDLIDILNAEFPEIEACDELGDTIDGYNHTLEFLLERYDEILDQVYPPLAEYRDLDEDDRLAFVEYIEAMGYINPSAVWLTDECENISERIAFRGTITEYADELIHELYDVPDYLERYIDIEAFANDLQYDYCVTDNFVFFAC